MFTPYRRPDAPDVPAPLFDPAATLLVDPLTGVVPTWRLDEEPIYLEVIRDLGVPGLADPAGPVVSGVVFPNPIDDPDEIVPVWLCELGDHAECDGYACPCCASGECPGSAVDVDEPVAPGMVRLCYCAPHPCSCDFEDGNEYPVRVDDAPPTRALRLAPAPAPDECPDCGAVDPNPCRPKSDPVHGRALTRQHRRRRALAEAGRGEFALVLLVLTVVVGIAVSVGGFLSAAVGPVKAPLCAVPTAAGCPDGPRP